MNYEIFSQKNIINLFSQPAVKWAGWAQRSCWRLPSPSPSSSESRFSLPLSPISKHDTWSHHLFVAQRVHRQMSCAQKNIMEWRSNVHLNVHQVVLRWTSLWWTTGRTWSASSGWTEPGLALLTLPWRRWDTHQKLWDVWTYSFSWHWHGKGKIYQKLRNTMSIFWHQCPGKDFHFHTFTQLN